MPCKLLLWDIDGTLIDSGGAGGRGLIEGFAAEFGIQDPMTWLDYYGRTDVWIARQILRHHGLSDELPQAHRLLEGYLRSLAKGIQNPKARLLPGVSDLIDRLGRRTDFVQGLLTGNLRRGAAIKLGHFDFLSPFSFGAYADDSENRNDLGPIAVKRATALTGLNWDPSSVFVIGDTPHDIACGRAFGAKTVAVATGRHSVSELRLHKPDLLFADFSEVDAVISELERAH